MNSDELRNNENENSQRADENNTENNTNPINPSSGFIYSSGGNSEPQPQNNTQNQSGGYQNSSAPNHGGYQRPAGYQGHPFGSPYYQGQPQGQGSSQYPYGQGRGYYAPPTKPPKKSKGKTVFGVIIGIVVLAIVIYGFYPIFTSVRSENTTAPSEQASTIEGANSAPTLNLNDSQIPKTDNPVGAKELSATEVYKKIKESAVGILVYASDGSIYTEGSGVIMGEDSEGKYTYILTCAHVISSRNSISVQLYDGTDYVAEIVGYDKRTDIGVLRIKAKGLKAAEFGNSEQLEVGQKVYAIGNPGGTEFAGSFTDGIISAIDRPINSSSTGYTMICIQHTAAINPGNSGGALVNSLGQVIGINSMKIVSTDYEGMGFAVPSKIFQEIFNQIVKNGYVPNRPKLGIKYLPASSYQNLSIVVQLKELPAGTIVIEEISPDSSLYNSKVQVKDLIIAVNGKPLNKTDVLQNLIEQSKVGDKLTLTIVRVNRNYSLEKFDVTVTLVEDKGDAQATEETTTSFFFPFD